MRSRIQALRGSLEREGLDGYLIANETNILYFTGFLGGVRLLVPRDGENILSVYGVNYEQARVEAKDCRVELVKRGENLEKRVADQIHSLKLQRVGFDTIDASVYTKLKKALKGVRLKPRSRTVWGLRKVKDENELSLIRKAAELTDEGMKKAFEVVKSGMREYELAAEIEYAMRRLGSGGTAFNTIVASGTRSAFPHGGCTETKIQEGDLIVLDVGATYQHYRADLTRTIMVGRPSEKQARIHQVVREAQEKAFQSIHTRVRACEADATARGIIEKEGYGQYFVHSLGHGIGLETHEPPTLSPESKDILKAGNVVTVEPGVYIVGFGGVRIEDTVLVYKDKAERLTKTPYELAVKR